MIDKLNTKYKNAKIILVSSLSINIIVSFCFYHISNKNNMSNLDRTIYKTYVETEESSGTYTIYSSNDFPTTGYVLNTTFSTCTNGDSVN